MATRATKDLPVNRPDGSVAVYTLLKCDAKVGIKSALRLFKVVAPAIERGFKNAESEDGSDVDFFGALVTAIDRVNEEDLDHFLDLMSKHTMVDGKMLSSILSEHFIDRYQEMMIVLYRWLEFNFASFFGGAGNTGLLGALLEKVQADMASRLSDSPKASTGSSTES